MRFACEWLHSEVELSAERAQHIADRHPDLTRTDQLIAATLADPDWVLRSSKGANVRKFVRQFEDKLHGRQMVVVVVSEDSRERHWIITAYAVRRLSKRGVEWTRQ